MHTIRSCSPNSTPSARRRAPLPCDGSRTRLRSPQGRCRGPRSREARAPQTAPETTPDSVYRQRTHSYLQHWSCERHRMCRRPCCSPAVCCLPDASNARSGLSWQTINIRVFVEKTSGVELNSHHAFRILMNSINCQNYSRSQTIPESPPGSKVHTPLSTTCRNEHKIIRNSKTAFQPSDLLDGVRIGAVPAIVPRSVRIRNAGGCRRS